MINIQFFYNIFTIFLQYFYNILFQLHYLQKIDIYNHKTSFMKNPKTYFISYNTKKTKF